MRLVLKTLVLLLLFSSLSLLLTSAYGLGKNLRPDNLAPEFLRFGERDLLLSKETYFSSVRKIPNETALEYAKRLTTVISDGTAHVDWEAYDPATFNQLVPIWENWILYLMGKFSGIPEFKRYHFSNPVKSMERGIGICGDASILMSQILTKNGVDNKIITFPGHVVVSASLAQQQFIFDPDFGVVIPYSLEQISKDSRLAESLYLDQGYSKEEERFLINEYAKPYSSWDGPQHLITKKFYFEKFAYIGKWVFPVSTIFLALWFLVRSNKN